MGFVKAGSHHLDDGKADIELYFPYAKSLISFVCRIAQRARTEHCPFGCQPGVPPYGRQGEQHSERHRLKA